MDQEEKFMRTYPLEEPVHAYLCWAVYANFNSVVPDTEDLCAVSAEDLAHEVCAWLDEHPIVADRQASVDGHNHVRRFLVRPTLRVYAHQIHTSLREVCIKGFCFKGELWQIL